MYIIPEENFYNLADKRNMYESMEASINLLLKNKQYTALLMFSVCCIDAFSGNKFINYVNKYFNKYFENGLLTPEIFYKEFRSKIVHGYSVGRDYAIVNNHEVDGNLTAKIKCSDRIFIALNIDKFIEDFIRHLKEKFNPKI